jgi:hypothetical protein
MGEAIRHLTSGQNQVRACVLSDRSRTATPGGPEWKRAPKKSVRLFRCKAHHWRGLGHPSRMRGRGEADGGTTNAPCSCQPVLAAQSALAPPIGGCGRKCCAAIRWTCQRILHAQPSERRGIQAIPHCEARRCAPSTLSIMARSAAMKPPHAAMMALLRSP